MSQEQQSDADRSSAEPQPKQRQLILCVSGSVQKTLGSTTKYDEITDVFERQISFLDLFHDLTGAKYKDEMPEITLKCVLSSFEASKPKIVRNLSLQIGEFLDSFPSTFRNIRFQATPANPQLPKPKGSGFDEIMKPKADSWPEMQPASPTERSRTTMRRDFIEMLKGIGAGFRTPQLSTKDGKSTADGFIDAACDLLWYMFQHKKTLEGRGCSVPDRFKLNSPYQSRDYLSRHPPGQIESNAFSNLLKAVSPYVLSGWMARKSWTVVHTDFECLVESAAEYIDYLKKQNEKAKETHERTTVNYGDLDVTLVRKGSYFGKHQSLAKKITDALSSKALYEEVCVTEMLACLPSRERYRFLKDFMMPFSASRFMRVFHGSQRPATCWFWKCNPRSEREPTEIARITQRIMTSLPESYHSRQAHADFVHKVKTVVNATSQVLLTIYQHLTGDKTATDIDPVKRELVEFALESRDPDLILDFRIVNGRPEKDFSEFWEKLNHVLDPRTLAHSRRREKIGYLPPAVSIRSLIEKAKALCSKDADIPSHSTVAFQFLPFNLFTEAAKRYTGHIKVRNVLISRTLRGENIDAPWVWTLCQYQQSWIIDANSKLAASHMEALLVMSDDKNALRSGNPEEPLAVTARRRKKSLAAPGQQPRAMDHDMGTFIKGQPSVIKVAKTPTVEGDSFNDGNVFVDTHDAVFDPSTPMRHAADLIQVMKQILEGGRKVPVLSILTDGGTDHNIAREAAQLSFIALFLGLDLDIFQAQKTAARHSWVNAIERIMAFLNYALQNVSLERPKMEDHHEKVFRTCNSLEDLRRAGQLPSFREALSKSAKAVWEGVGELFSELEMGGEKFTSFSLTDEMRAFVQTQIRRVDPNFPEGGSYHTEATRKWWKDHTRPVRKYQTTLYKRCHEDEKSDGCGVCKPIRMPMHVFEQLTSHFVPDPEPVKDNECKDGEKVSYKSYEEACAKPTTEEFLPSLKQKAKLRVDSQKVAVARVRSVMFCASCARPRCVYSDFALTTPQKRLLLKVQEEMDFHCGQFDIVAKDSEFGALHGVVWANNSLNCNRPVEKTYFSSNRFKSVCAQCGSPVTKDDEQVRKEREAKDHATYLPLCSSEICTGKGKGFIGRKKKLGAFKAAFEKKKAKLAAQKMAQKRRLSAKASGNLSRSVRLVATSVRCYVFR